MGYKSRGGWSIPVCLRDCRNRDIDCEECFCFSCFSPNVPVDLIGKVYEQGNEQKVVRGE